MHNWNINTLKKESTSLGGLDGIHYMLLDEISENMDSLTKSGKIAT